MKWTREQEQAIKTKGCNLLVAAGAGSGKTAVLVERIIRKVIDDKIDIDRLLVVTFTNAAASEMRERILDAIYKNLPEHPELNKQIVLLNKASIMTIDAFCKKVIKDNFFNVDLDPNFAVADTTENELIKLEALDEVMEALYDENPEIIEMYSDNKSDDNFRKMILNIYSFIQSCPFPEKWLNEKCEMYNIADKSDFGNTLWGKELIKYARNEILGLISELEEMADDLQNNNEATNYMLTLQDDILMLKALRLNNTSWDDFYEDISSIKFETLKRAPKVDEDTANEVKEIRNKAKDIIQKNLRDKIFISSSKEIFGDIDNLYSKLKLICDIVIRFSKAFAEKKSNRNLVDFSDMEHICLELLTNNENVANMYKNQYEEILVDEYQDSNLIQEYILNTISKNNVFMVGDVKQSIYRFRQARPELFLEKYNSYHNLEDGTLEEQNKILLFKNFRSNKNIIDQCNFIFKNVMSKEVGEIEYDDSESLKFGAEYYSREGGNAEIHLIDKALKEDDEEYDENEDDIEDKPQLEARVVAKRIEELVGNYEIYDKKLDAYRKAEYRDFAILFRATKNYVDSFLTELSNRNIPAFADVNSGYFENMEVQVIMSLLKIIDNPYQDIPLIAVLRSQIGEFSSNELTDIRLIDKNCCFYEAMQKHAANGNEKVQSFLNKLQTWRNKSKYLSLGELVWMLYKETGYYDYISLMPNGSIRISNLDALLTKAEKFEGSSYKGLFSFINYMDNIRESSSDFGACKTLGDSDNVVRLMSIHKSKGLEFPIVFLCGTARKFNTRDVSDKVILHQDYGFGCDVVDLDNRVTYGSIPKLAIKQKSLEESLSEEMRILYVALTRAREKLIITTLDNGLDKKIDKWSKKQNLYSTTKARCFAEWICGTVLSTDNDWEIHRWSYNDVLKLSMDTNENNYSTFIKNIDIIFTISDAYDDIVKNFNWEYSYKDSTKLPAKITVTELKRLGDELSSNQNEIIEKPSFMCEDTHSGGKFGTLLHNAMQRIDFNKFDIDSILENSDKKYYSLLKKYLEQFEKTDLCVEIKSAKRVCKEMPFNLSMKLNEIYKDVKGDSANDDILVQGVIDLYYELDDGIVLVDYKTDNLDTPDDFVMRYKVQLDYYKKALETLTGKKVLDVYIYSFKLNQKIRL